MNTPFALDEIVANPNSHGHAHKSRDCDFPAPQGSTNIQVERSIDQPSTKMWWVQFVTPIATPQIGKAYPTIGASIADFEGETQVRTSR